MSGHEQFGEDLALYAIGALSSEESAALEKHLATCAECRNELEQLRGDGALLAMATVGPKPPQRSRKRLLDAVAKEAAASPTLSQNARKDGAPAFRIDGAQETRRPISGRRAWWGWMGWAATAAVVVFAASLWMDNSALNQKVAVMSRQLAEQNTQLKNARDIVTTLTATDSLRVTLVAAKTPPQPQGKAFYSRERGNLVFMANNLPAVPAQKAYELWLIPMQGAPIPAGVFKPDAHGSATVVNPPLPAGTQAKAFAITIENEAGAPAPTMPILMMGAGE